jgi:hypothetical protein
MGMERKQQQPNSGTMEGFLKGLSEIAINLGTTGLWAEI